MALMKNAMRIAALCASALAAPCGGQVLDSPVPGRAIVRAKVGTPVEAVIAELHKALPDVTFAVADVSLAGRRLYLLDYEPASALLQVEPVLHALAATSAAADWGELRWAGHDPESHTGSVWFHTVGSLYAAQYAAPMLGLAEAHARSTGSGVVVAVLDTGIDAAHPVLAGRLAPGGYNFIAGGTDTADTGGHGTFVAGLIHLAAPDAKLLPVVVLDSDGIGDGWLFAQGLFHAIDRGVEVINLSLGSTYNSQAVEDALDEAKLLGIVVVAAGGNQNAGEAFEEFPAATGNALGVAAVNDLDVKADFSNYNEKFFISSPGDSTEQAPGEIDPDRSIVSALPGGEYGVWEGTSFSTAFVSGAAALIRAQHPEWPAGEITADQVAASLESTAVDISAQNPGYLGQLGAGRLDIAAAVQLGPPAPQLGDLDNDGTVSVNDLLLLLGAWGGTHSSADLDGDGTVSVTDLLLLLGNWG